MKIAVAPRGLEEVLANELGPVEHEGRLFFCGDRTPYFAQNLWLDVQEFKFKSISEAAKHLRAIQRNWWLHPYMARGRAKLIQDQLPPLKPKPVKFPSELPKQPMGSWTLSDENTMLYSAQCSSPFADGEVEFEENKTDPPSRAYLKLWETFTLEERRPGPGETAIDMGSSPGGWTWVLDQLGCDVISVDKAPLTIETSRRVKFIEESAFALEPRQVDWFFSDIICYPDRLLKLIERWRPFTKNFVCTIKFQGPTDFDAVGEFLKIQGSRVRHLHANKHELTWIKFD
jgi:23S rRNA (cytidine2498-2'-O)-methyltransferase